MYYCSQMYFISSKCVRESTALLLNVYKVHERLALNSEIDVNLAI